MMKYFIFLLLATIGSLSFTQDISPICDWTRATNWPVEQVLNVVNFDDKKEELGSDYTDDQVLEAILNSKPQDVSIQFSKKDYHFKKQIKLNSHCSLIGSGSKTKLIFDLEKEQDAILVQGQLTRDTIRLSTEIDIQSSDCFDSVNLKVVKEGEFYLLADDDEHLIESWWAKGKTGQVLKIGRVVEGDVQFTDWVNRFYGSDAYLIKMLPIQQVEISNLTIVNKTKTAGQTSNICFRYAYNCLVKDVESEYSNYSHVLFEFSSHSGVRHSTFKRAHDYGNGGKGYGAVMQFATSSCFIEQCKFDSLRHSILLQAGANGNYIAHNESTHPYWTDVKLPASSAGDIVLHGNFAYANLFEFNICQTIVIDKSHGFNGPYNTFFANEVRGYGIWQIKGGSCGPQYFINNVLVGEKVRFKAKDKDYHQYNLLNGKLIEAGTTKNTKKSMIQGSSR